MSRFRDNSKLFTEFSVAILFSLSLTNNLILRRILVRETDSKSISFAKHTRNACLIRILFLLGGKHII